MRRGNVARTAATHGSSTRAPNRGSRHRRRAANPGVVARQHRREAVAFFARRTRVPEGAARGTVGGSQARALADTSCRCVRNLVRARGRVSTPERPRAATGFQPDVSRTRPWPLPALLPSAPWLTARPTAPHHAGSSPVSGWFLRAATAAADGAQPLRDVATGARRARAPRHPPRPRRAPIASPDPTAYRGARADHLRPLPPLSPPQAMMNPYGTAGQVMYPGYLVRSRAAHPSPRRESRLGNRGTPPPHDEPRLTTARNISSLYPSGELRRRGFRHGRRRG